MPQNIRHPGCPADKNKPTGAERLRKLDRRAEIDRFWFLGHFGCEPVRFRLRCLFAFRWSRCLSLFACIFSCFEQDMVRTSLPEVRVRNIEASCHKTFVVQVAPPTKPSQLDQTDGENSTGELRSIHFDWWDALVASR